MPVPNCLWQALRHRYPAYWVVYSRLQSWVPRPASDVQDFGWAKHPNKRFCENLLEFWSQCRWHFPNDPKVSDCRVTWQELLYVVAEFGIVQGFLEPKVRLSLLTRRFRDHSVRVLSAAGVSVIGLSDISHLRCLTGGNAAGICARRHFRFPEVVWGFLIGYCLAVSNRTSVTKNPSVVSSLCYGLFLIQHISCCDVLRPSSRMLRGSNKSQDGKKSPLAASGSR